ncbi:24597_t:CDS:2 [Cetraspora pellucida]|uniref:24597_t:CDS:1 n=1 Tax=Cetraspora pellucida TaxID=1433469 RepID=A0A9N8WK21_9GLOM|nr:24597_t:CDS:2 [Cetraspora pellucida]
MVSNNDLYSSITILLNPLSYLLNNKLNNTTGNLETMQVSIEKHKNENKNSNPVRKKFDPTVEHNESIPTILIIKLTINDITFDPNQVYII